MIQQFLLAKYPNQLYRLAGLLSLLLLAPGAAWASFGIYQDYAIVNANGSGNRYLAGGANSDGAPAFGGQNFGAFSSGQSLVLGSEIKTFKNNGSNVTGARLFYRVYLSSMSANGGNFTETNPAFSNDNIDGTTGNQKWTNVSNSQGNNSPTPVNVLAGLQTTGTYILEVYWTAQASNEPTVVENNANSNYKATFDFTGPTPMPVTLTAFVAQRQGTDALLGWTTATETDNAGYEVQASPTGAAADYQVLGFVPAPSAASQTLRTYIFRDQQAGKAGLRYYRLRQVDLSGRASFSPVRTVQFEAGPLLLTAAPNPFSSRLLLYLQLPQAAAVATLTLRDALGREVLRQVAGDLPAGASQLAINSEALPAGVYMARLALPTGVQVLRLLKE